MVLGLALQVCRWVSQHWAWPQAWPQACLPVDYMIIYYNPGIGLLGVICSDALFPSIMHADHACISTCSMGNSITLQLGLSAVNTFETPILCLHIVLYKHLVCASYELHASIHVNERSMLAICNVDIQSLANCDRWFRALHKQPKNAHLG